MSLRRIAVIANPCSRNYDASKMAAALQMLNSHIPTEFFKTERRGDAEKLAAGLGGDPETLVAVCGGDGTLYEAVNGMPSNGVLGLIPTGTANVVAREFGVPLDIREAAKALLTGAVQRLDVGVVNGRRFLMSAGFGFDAHVAAAVKPILKRLCGCYAFHLQTVIEYLFYRPPRMHIEIDGKICETAAYVLCANLRRYGGDLFFAPSARPDDGLLDIVVLKNLSFGNFIKTLWRAKNRIERLPKAAKRLKGRRVKIRCDRPAEVQLDGEVLNAVETATVEICPALLQMVIP